MLKLLENFWRYKRTILITAKLDLSQKYAGSALGSIWVFIYPILFLSIYLFLYLVVFQARFPGMSSLGYVVYVFSGLVPYLVIMESVTRGTLVIRENAHLIRNVIMPINLIPVRVVITSFMVQAPAFLLLLLLISVDGNLTWRIVFLPIVIFTTGLMLTGVVYIVSGVGALFSDTTYVVNLVMLLLMFLSPIAFDSSMVPNSLQAVIWLNPVSYPLEASRWVLLENANTNYYQLFMFPLLALFSLYFGLKFFNRLKGMIADNV